MTGPSGEGTTSPSNAEGANVNLLSRVAIYADTATSTVLGAADTVADTVLGAADRLGDLGDEAFAVALHGGRIKLWRRRAR